MMVRKLLSKRLLQCALNIIISLEVHFSSKYFSWNDIFPALAYFGVGSLAYLLPQDCNYLDRLWPKTWKLDPNLLKELKVNLNVDIKSLQEARRAIKAQQQPGPLICHVWTCFHFHPWYGKCHGPVWDFWHWDMESDGTLWGLPSHLSLETVVRAKWKTKSKRTPQLCVKSHKYRSQRAWVQLLQTIALLQLVELLSCPHEVLLWSV